MKAAWIVLLAVICAVGCSSDAPPPNAPPPQVQAKQEAPPPEAVVEKNSPIYDQLHSGLYQADAAVKKMADALEIARDVQGKVTGNLVGPLKDMVATLNDDGATLADSTGGEPPTEDQVKQDSAKYQTKRDSLINKITDCLKDMREQDIAAADLGDNGPDTVKKQCAKLDRILNQIIDDLLGALTALGGKDEGKNGGN